MSKTRSQDDFWQLRRLARQLRKRYAEAMARGEPLTTTQRAPEVVALERQFRKLWEKYGLKSMVMDRRRRVSTRKANQKAQRAEVRANKRHERQGLQHDVASALKEGE